MGFRKGVIDTGFKIFGATRMHRALAPVAQGLGAILMFHRVRPAVFSRDGSIGFAPNAGLEITPDFLDRLLTRLAQTHDIIDLDAAIARVKTGEGGRPFVALTFDDGYRDTLEIAAPILMRHKAPFTVFVTSGFADRSARLWWVELEAAIAALSHIRIHAAGRNFDLETGDARQKQAAFAALYWPLRAGPEAQLLRATRQLCAMAGIDSAALVEELCLDWAGLRRLADCPLATIGAHTITHPMLAKHERAFVEKELRESRAEITRETGRSVHHLAYPVGDPASAGPREFALAQELGFTSAVTTRPGMVFAGHKNHLTALPRLSINGFHQTLPAIDMLLSGAPFLLWNRGRRVMAS